MYKIMNTVLGADIHPFSLTQFAESDKMTLKLHSLGDRILPEDQMHVYRNFRPFALELSYLYEILILMASFGLEFITVYVDNPEEPILIEGVRKPSCPYIEAVVAPVLVGMNGIEAEMKVVGNYDF